MQKNYNIYMKKFCLFSVAILSLISCSSGPVTKVDLSYRFIHENTAREEVFSHEITAYEDYKNKNTTKESFIMYIYDDFNCMCYSELKNISLNTVISNDLLVYTMDVAVIKGNSFGYKTSGHSYPSICIFEKGYLKYQVNFDEERYFYYTEHYETWLFERINLTGEYIN